MTAGRGWLIVFEGLDRSGKSTQCERLVGRLRYDGQKVEHLRFPDRTTPIGKMISSYLSGNSQQEDHVIHLLFSANRWELANTIRTLVNDNTTVVVDRYYYSGCVYSAAKGIAGMGLEWCREPEVGLPRPDMCLFLNLSTEEAAKRGGYGLERYESQDMQEKVRGLFAEMREHHDEADDIVAVDAGRSVEEVENAIYGTVARLCSRMKESELPLRSVRPW